MSFEQLFIIAILMTVGASVSTAVIVVRELRSRKAQRHGQFIFTPATELMNSDTAQPTGPDPELLYAISRLG